MGSVNRANNANPTPQGNRPAAAPAAQQGAASPNIQDKLNLGGFGNQVISNVSKGWETSSDAAKQQLEAFLQKNPYLREHAEELKKGLAADAIILILSAGAGAGANVLWNKLKNKDEAIIDEMAKSPDPIMRRLVAEKQKLSVGTMMALAVDPDISVRFALAKRLKREDNDVAKEVVEIFSNDESPKIRALVADSPNLSENTLRRLAGLGDDKGRKEDKPEVWAVAFYNPKMEKGPLSKFKEMIEERNKLVFGGGQSPLGMIQSAVQGDERAALGLLLAPGTQTILPESALLSLAKSESPAVRQALARRSDLPGQMLNDIYEKREYSGWQKFCKGLGGIGRFLAKLTGTDLLTPAKKGKVEEDRLILMSLANNPNSDAPLLTKLLQNPAKPRTDLESTLSPDLDRRLGLTPLRDMKVYGTDVVKRAIVGNPHTDDTVRTIASTSNGIMQIDANGARQAFLLLSHANELRLMGDYPKAIEQYNKALEQGFRDNEQAYCELGLSYAAMISTAPGDKKREYTDKAIAALSQALKVNPDYSAARELLQQVQFQSNGR